MSFDWAEYLWLAQALCGAQVSGPPAGIEARQHAAVSRAYYAAYVLARNRLMNLDGIAIAARANPHQFVGSNYQQSGDPQRARIGIELGRVVSSRPTPWRSSRG